MVVTPLKQSPPSFYTINVIARKSSLLQLQATLLAMGYADTAGYKQSLALTSRVCYISIGIAKQIPT